MQDEVSNVLCAEASASAEEQAHKRFRLTVTLTIRPPLKPRVSKAKLGGFSCVTTFVKMPEKLTIREFTHHCPLLLLPPLLGFPLLQLRQHL